VFDFPAENTEEEKPYSDLTLIVLAPEDGAKGEDFVRVGVFSRDRSSWPSSFRAESQRNIRAGCRIFERERVPGDHNFESQVHAYGWCKCRDSGGFGKLNYEKENPSSCFRYPSIRRFQVESADSSVFALQFV